VFFVTRFAGICVSRSPNARRGPLKVAVQDITLRARCANSRSRLWARSVLGADGSMTCESNLGPRCDDDATLDSQRSACPVLLLGFLAGPACPVIGFARWVVEPGGAREAFCSRRQQTLPTRGMLCQAGRATKVRDPVASRRAISSEIRCGRAAQATSAMSKHPSHGERVACLAAARRGAATRLERPVDWRRSRLEAEQHWRARITEPLRWLPHLPPRVIPGRLVTWGEVQCLASLEERRLQKELDFTAGWDGQ
jgi:hypothetical protein